MFTLPIKSRMEILKGRSEYESSWKGKFLMLVISKTPEKKTIISSKYRAKDFIRLLVVVTKKFDKRAVIRNKFKRRVKEAFNSIDKDLIKNNYDYQIILKFSILEASFQEIIQDIERCLKGEAKPFDLNAKNTSRSKK